MITVSIALSCERLCSGRVFLAMPLGGGGVGVGVGVYVSQGRHDDALTV